MRYNFYCTFNDKFLQMVKMRKNGATYSEIGKVFGMSKQRVCKIIGISSEFCFKPITDKQCCFFGIRNWLNTNKVCITDFVRKIFGVFHENKYRAIIGYLSGKHDMKRELVDRILFITGLTYEQAFMEGN